MAKKDGIRGLELAMALEDLADHMLVRGKTGPVISGVLREFAAEIRRAPDFGRDITEAMWHAEVLRLVEDLGQSLAVMESRGAGRRRSR